MTRVLNFGEVTLVDHMAGDHKVCGAARVSTGKGLDSSKGEEADRGLISYLMTHGHGTPFEHSTFQWFVKAPIFVVREWQRHRMASYNEQSGRYAEFLPEFYVPDHVREPDPGNKQGAVPAARDPEAVRGPMWASVAASFDVYEALIADNVAREMARMVLPVNIYTRFWFTVNARSLMNFLELRNHAAAQWEIRQYAVELEKDFAALMPWTHDAFVANDRRAP